MAGNNCAGAKAACEPFFSNRQAVAVKSQKPECL